jgi:hypothetical protein
LKTYLSFILLFLLTSCGNAPTIQPTNQCSAVFKFTETGDISSKESYCICRKYVFTIERVGPEGGSFKEPIQSCDKLVGWKPKEYSIVAEYWEALREYIVEVMREHGY